MTVVSGARKLSSSSRALFSVPQRIHGGEAGGAGRDLRSHHPDYFSVKGIKAFCLLREVSREIEGERFPFCPPVSNNNEMNPP